jgi:adenine-specific DNA-methyltransferase
MGGWTATSSAARCPSKEYVADFACMRAKLVVELDGGQHASMSAADHRRTTAIEAAGYSVIRF